jgi:very-short-patch-repair endonuclease
MPVKVHERALVEIARRQHGVFTLAQTLACGFTRPVVRRKLGRQEWEEVVPRVYRTAAAAAASWRSVQMAVVLASNGIASHRAACALHGLCPEPPVHEVTAARAPRSPSGALIHTTNDLPAHDCTVVDGMPTTTVARTLIDVGGVLPLAEFEDVLDRAIIRRAVTIDRLQTRARELWAPRRSGCAVVLDLLAQRRPPDARAANEWEAKVVRAARACGLPEPRLNHRVRVGGRIRYLDLAWPEAKVAVEFDGFLPHSTRRVFDDDRARQNDLVADGWIVFRITAPMLRDVPRTFAPIADALERRSRAGWHENVPEREALR